MSDRDVFLPRRAGESDEEARFREAINRQCSQLLATVDAALRTRTLPPEGQRARGKAKGLLTDFATTARAALDWRHSPHDPGE